MKPLPTTTKPQPRRHPPAHSARRPFSPFGSREKWLLLSEVEEGPNAVLRELSERIARGQMIRGRAL
jgi:hypothetical protein